jgi:glycosyltransferase involved in cell wall biosynthesis
MRIALDIGPSSNDSRFRGIGTYVEELSKNMPKFAKSSQITYVNSLKEQEKYDVFHTTSFKPFEICIPFIKPSNCKVVVTIYDLIPLIYPQVYKPGIRGTINWMLNKYLLKKNVDGVITISETSKKDIVRFTGLAPEKVHVTYLGAKEDYKKLEKKNTAIIRKYSLPEKFAFYYGDINFNKNIPTLIEGCKLAGIPLVMGGKQAVEIENMDLDHPENAHLKDLDLSGVIRTGYISDTEANEILNIAYCLVQPSFYEGFGLSIVHAFAAGCPVVASRTQALTEVGDNACVYFDPKSAADLSEKIKNLEDMRKDLITKGFVRLKDFSWEKTAKETYRIYEKI